ncbi:MAG: type IV pilus modification PilV family protein [Bacillota bacterium]
MNLRVTGTKRLALACERYRCSGYTLVEVLLATVLLVAAVVPLMTALINGARWTVESRDIVVALNLAQGKLEELKNKPYAVLEQGEPLDPSSPAGSFAGYPDYAYRLEVSQIDVSGDGRRDVKTVKVVIYHAATDRQVLALTMDKGDWK